MLKTNLKGAAIAAAVASLCTVGIMAPGHAQAAAKKVKCEGANSCKGTGSCKGADHDCKGKNTCKGTGFTEEKDKAACEKKGGKAAE